VVALLLAGALAVALAAPLAFPVAVLAAREPDANDAASACWAPAANKNAAARIAPDRCTTGDRTNFEVVIPQSPDMTG
jgi:hypothetical protein